MIMFFSEFELDSVSRIKLTQPFLKHSLVNPNPAAGFCFYGDMNDL